MQAWKIFVYWIEAPQVSDSSRSYKVNAKQAQKGKCDELLTSSGGIGLVHSTSYIRIFELSLFFLNTWLPSTSRIKITPMQSLLRWSVENSSSSAGGAPPAPRKDLDPGIIDHILGKPDAQLMKEALEVAVNEAQIEDDRLRALDDLEMVCPLNVARISSLTLPPHKASSEHR
jgi:hypothetical protein